MTLRRKKLGKRGEDLAAGYLEKQGYTILERNYRTRFGEVDIIAEKNSILYFVEVKTRLHADFREGYSEYQRKNLTRLAQAYLAKKGIEQQVSFLVAGIKVGQSDDDPVEINVIEDSVID